MKENFEIENNHTPFIMPHLFQFSGNIFSLGNLRKVVAHNSKTSNYGLESVSYRVPFTSAKLPSDYRNSKLQSKFTAKITNWEGSKICPCNLCKDYLENVRYVWYDKIMGISVFLQEFYTNKY